MRKPPPPLHASHSTSAQPWLNRAWLLLFAVWGVLLSGLLGSTPTIGTPGGVQALRLHTLHQARQKQLLSLQTEIARLREDSDRLERSRVTQQREIRRTLGYAAPDEIIFDFSDPESI